MADDNSELDLMALALQMQLCRQKFGVGYLRQSFELVRYCIFKRSVSLPEYYQYGMYRRELTKAQKNAFVGAKANSKLTRALNTLSFTDYHTLFEDKLTFDLVMKAQGLTPPKLHAYYGAEGAAYVKTLRSAEDVVRYLTEEAEFPLFCKPRFASLGEGATQINSLDRETGLISRDGVTTEPLQVFVDSIVDEYGDGYLFQSAISQSDALVNFFGKPPVVFRVTTVNSGSGEASVLYVLARISDPEGSGVLEHTDGLYNAEVDPETGRMCSDFWMLDEYFSDGLHSETNTRIHRDEIIIPDMAEMCRMACQAHDLFPTIRIIGFDFILTTDGPVILEGNFLPYSRTIQRLRDKGFKAPDFDERLLEMMAALREKPKK